jgi:hypothetical protein
MAQLIECRLRDAEINRRIGAPEPVQVAVAKPAHIFGAEDGGAFEQPAFVEDQRVAAARAHAEHISIRVDPAAFGFARQQQDDAGRRVGRALRICHHQDEIGRFEH